MPSRWGINIKHRLQWLQPTTPTRVATPLSGSQSRGIRHGKLLILNHSIPICNPKIPSVIGVLFYSRISPTSLISPGIFLKRYSPSGSLLRSAPTSVI